MASAKLKELESGSTGQRMGEAQVRKWCQVVLRGGAQIPTLLMLLADRLGNIDSMEIYILAKPGFRCELLEPGNDIAESKCHCKHYHFCHCEVENVHLRTLLTHFIWNEITSNLWRVRR